MPTTVEGDSPNLQDRSPRTIGQDSNKENETDQLFPPRENTRRGSCPTESLREAVSNNYISKDGGTTKKRLAKSYSFNEGVKQPTICLDGIPLGSLTAQEAAKSFWNMDMLHQRLQKITECAAQETSSLGSSLESFDLEDTSNEPMMMKLDEETVAQSAPSSPRLSPEVTYTRSHSAGHRLKSNLLTTRPRSAVAPVLTPPYLSPGATRRAHHSYPDLMVRGRRMNLSPKSSDSTLSDDGYFDL